MDSLKYDLKLFLDETSEVDLDPCIPIFHHWIQEQCLDEVLIDVADYRHVHHGPGVILIAHDAHYGMDLTGGRAGLLYSRRRETSPSRATLHSTRERLHSVFHCALTAAQRLEAEAAFEGRLRFRGDELLLRINDRLLAPNTAETFEHLCAQLQPFLATLYAEGTVKMAWHADPKSAMTVTIKTAYAPHVGTLLTRLESNGMVGGEQS